jgi:predicted membrane protein
MKEQCVLLATAICIMLNIMFINAKSRGLCVKDIMFCMVLYLYNAQHNFQYCSSFDIAKKLLFLFNLKQSNLDQCFFSFAYMLDSSFPLGGLVEKTKAFQCPVGWAPHQNFVRCYSLYVLLL